MAGGGCVIVMTDHVMEIVVAEQGGRL
uniref:Uncharacterized protein n=1 Tax=Anguilla anguilla TaxID=7936 RepID=A0A0E9XSF2_ANGAN